MTLKDAWWAHLAEVRWFGGKGTAGSISELTPLPWYTASDAVPALRSEIATIDYADGRREFYHLLVAHYPAGSAPVEVLGTVDGRDVVDATADPAAVAAFVDACWAGVPALTWSHPQPAPEAVGVWPGEQSNTTLTLDKSALFKLFRRVEPGTNLDADVLAALDGSEAAVPAMYGRLVGAWPQGQTTDLGVIIERVAGAADGWVLATQACAAGEDFTADAHALGAELAVVHRALAEAFGTSEASGDDLADTMVRRLDEAVAAAEVLAPYRDALASSFDALRGRTLPAQQVHGDFHLGQTLRSVTDAGVRWAIIDFEGEPAKTAAERRAPEVVWRDVAGMLRSFDYARSAQSDPTSAAARDWAAAAQQAFVAGYCGAAGAPADVLDAYQADKCVYEVVYETRNRPDWVAIPLGAVAELAGQ